MAWARWVEDTPPGSVAAPVMTCSDWKDATGRPRVAVVKRTIQVPGCHPRLAEKHREVRPGDGPSPFTEQYAARCLSEVG